MIRFSHVKKKLYICKRTPGNVSYQVHESERRNYNKIPSIKEQIQFMNNSIICGFHRIYPTFIIGLNYNDYPNLFLRQSHEVP